MGGHIQKTVGAAGKSTAETVKADGIARPLIPRRKPTTTH